MTLESSLGGSGGLKSSISNVDRFYSLKDETGFDCFSTLSIAAFYTEMDLVKTTEESGLDSYQKGK